MAIPSLLGSYIDETYQRIVQTTGSGAEFADGLGNPITFGTTNTGSLLLTASVSLNKIEFTKGDNTKFSITVDTGSAGTVSGDYVTTSSFNAFTSSVVTTSSFNSFTASYNSGSFTGSFTGLLFGTSSWAYSSSVAISSSYALSSSYATYAENGGVTKVTAGGGIIVVPSTGVGDVTINSMAASYNTATGSFGSFYDTGSYLATSATTVYSMSLSTTDISNGVSISGSQNPYRTYIKFANAGVYNLQFSAQFSNSDNIGQDVVIWLRRNDNSSVNDLPDSTGTVTVPPRKGFTNGQIITSWNYFITVSSNDYVQLLWHAPVANAITLETLAAGTNPTHPRTPALILTAQRVDTFLSNTGSFSGSFNGEFTGSLQGTSSWAINAITSSYVSGDIFTGNNIATSASYVITSSYAIAAGNASTIDINVFGSPVDSYLLMSNVAGITGVAIGGDVDLRYNSSTNVLTVGNVSATTLTGSLQGTASWADNARTASFLPVGTYNITSSWAINFVSASNYVLNSATSSFVTSAQTSSFVTNSQTSSFVQNSQTSSFVTNSQTSSFVTNSQTSSFVQNNQTSSFVQNSQTSSFVTNSQTSSFVQNSQTSSFVLNSQTSSMTVATASFVTASNVVGAVTSASYAISSSYASNGGVTQIIQGTNITISSTGPSGTGAVTINSTATGGGGTGANISQSFTNQSTWTFVHGLGVQGVIIQAYDSGWNQIIPQNISSSNTTTAVITFPTNESGWAIASLGGSTTTAQTASYVNSLNQNVIISGSLTVGQTTAGASENTVTLAAKDNGSEGGQLGFNAPGGTYTSSSFIDNFENKLRILSGPSNAGSTSELIKVELSNGNTTLNGGSIIMPTRPAFRVSGSSVTGIAASTVITSTQGAVVEYNQGSYYTNTTGTFTAPLAGLYHVYFNCRTQTAGGQQVIIYKNTNIAQMMWETNTNTGHFGISSILRLAVNDTLQAKVTVGTVQFDSNDNWGVAYIG